MANNANIIFPQSEFIDSTSGRPSFAWMLWLMSPSVLNLNLSNPLSIASGGTGTNVIPQNGQLLIGNGTGYSVTNLTASIGISIINSAGAIAIANTGVLAVTGTLPIVSTGGQNPIISINSSALTKIDDANVTITLNGSPSTALLSPTSITAGWSGDRKSVV